MSIILVLIPLSILFAVAFLAAFIWAVRSGQYEDTCTPSMRLLLDDTAGVGRRMGPPSPQPSPPGEGETPPASGHDTHSQTCDDSGFARTEASNVEEDHRTSPKPHDALPLLEGEGWGEGGR